MANRQEQFQDVICQASASSVYETAITEWVLGDFDTTLDEECACGAPITIKHPVRNTITGTELVIGSECITKFASPDLTKAAKLRLKAAKGSENGKRMCHYCCNYRIPEGTEGFRTFCDTCYREGTRQPAEVYLMAFGSPCKDCAKLFVPLNSYSTSCYECYNKKRASSSTVCDNCKEEPTLGGKKFCAPCARLLSRMCEQCHAKNINANSPDYIKLCETCGQQECDMCSTTFRAYWPGSTTCSDCRKSEMEFARTCFGCGLAAIAPSEPDTVTHCKKCAATIGGRECRACKLPKIRANTKSFVVMCDDCLEADARKKGKTPQKCLTPKCNTMVPARDLHWRQYCGPCNMKNKK